MRYVLATAPTGYPVSLDEARAHVREDSNDQDSVLEMLIAAATQHLDGRVGILGRAILSQSWRIDAWRPDGGRIIIDMPTVTSIASVKYLSSGSELTWSSSEYRLGSCGNRFFVEVKDGFSWPTADDQEDAYRVTFVAGWANAAAVPAPIKAAILLMVGDLYEHRETVAIGVSAAKIPMSPTVDALIAPYRYRKL